MLPLAAIPIPPLQHSAEIGDNLSEEIWCDYSVKELRRFHHPHAGSVHVRVTLLDVGILFTDFGEDTSPNILGPYGVSLVDQREFLLFVASSAE